MMSFLKNQKAMIFGMDARVTLAVTSILLLIVGFNQFTDSNKSNEIQANVELKLIKIGTEIFYENNYKVPSINDLIDQKYIDLEAGVNSDPWGNNYEIGNVVNTEVFNGTTAETKYIYVLSYGKDGVKSTATPADKTAWQSLKASGDDLLIKFNTLKIEEKLTDIESKQLEIVKFLLESYVNEKEKENSDYCAIVGNQNSSRCDVNQDGKYEYKEELALNYMPKVKSDGNGKYYITINGVHSSENIFKSGYIDINNHTAHNMYTFISLIGGNQELVKSPRGLVLHFNSNVYGNTENPYYAQIWYGNEVTIY